LVLVSFKKKAGVKDSAISWCKSSDDNDDGDNDHDDDAMFALCLRCI
jgi:hypothetical protein